MAEAPRSRLIPSLLLRIGEAGDFPSNHGFKSMPSLPAKRSRLDLKGVRLSIGESAIVDPCEDGDRNLKTLRQAQEIQE